MEFHCTPRAYASKTYIFFLQDWHFINKLVIIAIASEYLVDKDVFSTSWYSTYFSELLSLTFDNIGTFITQTQVFMKSDCFKSTSKVEPAPKVVDATNHVNDMFTQVEDVISLLDKFHLFIVTDPAVLTKEPYNGQIEGLTKM